MILRASTCVDQWHKKFDEDSAEVVISTHMLKQWTTVWSKFAKLHIPVAVAPSDDGEGWPISLNDFVILLRTHSPVIPLFLFVNDAAADKIDGAKFLQFASEYKAILPENIASTVAVHRNAHELQRISQLLTEGKVVGHIEIAKLLGDVQGMQPCSVLKDKDVFEFAREILQKEFDRALTEMLRKISKQQVDEFLENSSTVAAAAETWDFTKCNWHIVENTEAVSSVVKIIDAVLLNRAAQLRVVRKV